MDFIKLLNQFYKEVYKQDAGFSEDVLNSIKETIFDKAKSFLQRLIDNGHIESIPSEKKSGPDINDYIKYIATTEDPIKTLSSMIK